MASHPATLRATRSCESSGDASAAWTLDELARRFGMSIGDAIRVMSDLEAIDFVRRIGDEYVPSRSAAV